MPPADAPAGSPWEWGCAGYGVIRLKLVVRRVVPTSQPREQPPEREVTLGGSLRRLFSSLRFRLIMLVLLAILPALALILGTNLEERRHTAAEAQQQALWLARLAAFDYAQSLESARQLLYTLAQLPQVRDGDREGCQALFGNLLARYPFFTSFGVSTPGGEVLCSAPPITGPVNFSDQAWYQQLIQEKDFVVGGYQVSRISGKAVVILAYPVLDASGLLQTVVTAELDPGWLDQLLAEVELPTSSAYIVVDHDGKIVARYPDAGTWVGRSVPELPVIQTVLAQGEGVTEAYGVDGTKRLYGFASLGSGPGEDIGVVAIGISSDAVLADANRALARDLTLLGLVTILALAAAWVGGHLLVLRQTQALLDTTRQLAAGDLDARTRLQNPRGEIGQLAQAFDEMAQALQQRELGREQAEEALCQRNRELTLLNRVIAASVAYPEPVSILEAACRYLAQAFDVPQAAAALLNGEKTAAVVVAEYVAEGRPSALNDTIPVQGNPSFQYLLTHKTPLVVADAQHDSRLSPIHDLMRRRDTVSLLILPLIVEGEVVGSLGLDAAQPRQFLAGEVSLAWSVADQVAGALARAQLAQRLQRLGTAIEQTAECVVILDTQGAVLYVNPAFERVTGYSRGEILGQSLDILRSGKQDDAFFQEMWATIKAGKVWQGRIHNRKKDGTLYTEETTITPVRDENRAIVNYVEVKRDVTRELQLEEQYLQAQKMEAVGQLTAGISHDFNNLLTAINGFAELLGFELPPDDPRQELAEKILYSGRRAVDLVRKLLAFSRKQIIEPQVLDLNRVVTEMEKMLQRIIGEHIELRTSLEPDLWPVKADPAQIEQVIVNLAVNARDAMVDGGKLTIETANLSLGEDYAAEHLEAQPGEHVLLAVSDTGIGMSQEVQTRIFEPFFTTKARGEGTGLGLATVYGIVKQSGGHIQVYSEEGQGTTFKVYLPRTGEAKTSLFRRPDAESKLPSGDETILLVEDDAGVRDLARRLLLRQGYTVLEAGDGQAALRVAARHAGPIHLLLTDVVLPGMSGQDLAQELTQTRPHLRVLFMSGYTDKTIMHHGVLAPGVSFVQKPFSPMDLAPKVRQALDGPRPAGLEESSDHPRPRQHRQRESDP